MLVELLVLVEGFGVHDGIGALIALVRRIQMQSQMLHVLSVLLLLDRVLQVLGHVELELSPAVVAVQGDVELGQKGRLCLGLGGRERIGADKR